MLSEVTYLVSRITERERAKTRGTLSDLSLIKDTYAQSYLGGNTTCNVERGPCMAFSSKEQVTNL